MEKKKITLLLVPLVLSVVAFGVMVGTGMFESNQCQHLNVDAVESEDELSGEVIRYNEMNEEQQKLFVQAVEENKPVPIPDDIGGEVWIENHGVSYEGSTYATRVATC